MSSWPGRWLASACVTESTMRWHLFAALAHGFHHLVHFFIRFNLRASAAQDDSRIRRPPRFRWHTSNATSNTTTMVAIGQAVDADRRAFAWVLRIAGASEPVVRSDGWTKCCGKQLICFGLLFQTLADNGSNSRAANEPLTECQKSLGCLLYRRGVRLSLQRRQVLLISVKFF